MKFKLILISVFAFHFLANAQSSVKIKQTAQMLSDATMNGDYDILMRYTYPKAVAMMGGKAKAIATIRKGLEEMKSSGVSFRSFVNKEPGKIFVAGNELHCLVPQIITLNVEGGYATSESSMLAISSDKGKSWTFLSAGNISKDRIRKMLPNFNKDLIIPAQTSPVFHRE